MQATGNPSFRSGTRKPGTVGVPVFDTEISIRPLGGGDAAAARRARRGLHPRPAGDARLRAPARRPPPSRSTPTAGSTPATSGSSTRTATCRSSTAPRTCCSTRATTSSRASSRRILFGVPGVAGAAVVGRPDEEAGELPVAYVVRKADDAGAALTAESVMAAVNDKVTPYKRLRDVVFIDAIPVSAAGKVLKRELAAQGAGEAVEPTARRDPNGCGGAHRAAPAHYCPRGWKSSAVGAETEHTGVQLAHEEQSPVRQVWRRVVIAVVVLVVHRRGHLPRPGRLPGRRRRRPVAARLVLLRDGHPLDHRLRRHHADHARRPAGQHPADHAAAHHVPARPHRNDPRGAHRALAGGVPHPTLEVPRAPARHRVRLRHQGPQRHPLAAGPRHAAGQDRRRRPRAPGHRRGQLPRAHRDRRRRRPHRGAPAGLGRARPRRHRRGQPGRRRRPHHAHRAAAQPERADHDQCPRGGERQPAAAVRRQHGHHHVGDVRPAARPLHRRPARGRRRRGPGHRRPGARPAPAHGSPPARSASTRARCATSSCRSPAAAARCASTTR